MSAWGPGDRCQRGGDLMEPDGSAGGVDRGLGPSSADDRPARGAAAAVAPTAAWDAQPTAGTAGPARLDEPREPRGERAWVAAAVAVGLGAITAT